MAIDRTFLGVDQSSVASLETGGVLYRCYVYRRVQTAGTGVTGGGQIRARCFVEQPGSASVELFDEVVAAPDTAGGDYVDCPKIIAVGTTFVVCYLSNDGSADRLLHMSSLDISTIGAFGPGFTDHGSIATHDAGLFDLVNAKTDQYFSYDDELFLVVHMIADDEFAVRLHDGFDWVSTVWITNYTTPADIADSILAAHCMATLVEPHTLVTYQTLDGGEEGGGVIRTARFTTTNGVNTHDTRSFTAIPASVRAVQCGHDRIGSATVGLVIEYADVGDLAVSDNYVRWVAMVALDMSNTSQLSAEHNAANLHMLSRPFALPSFSDSTPFTRLFCAVGFKNTGATSTYNMGTPTPVVGDWAQSLAFVVDLDWERWNNFSDLEVRPFPCAQMPFLQVDARASGHTRDVPINGRPAVVGVSTLDARRTNHLTDASPPPTFGPGVKSVTLALDGFSRVETVGQTTSASETDGVRVLPVGGTIHGFEFHYEEPWWPWRDGRTEPSGSYSDVVPDVCHQALNVGRHIVFGGACPVIYDGVQHTELGSLWDPEIVDIIGAVGEGDGGLAEGVYYYTAIYERTDNMGFVHRSGPAVPVAITLEEPSPGVVNANFLRIRTMTISMFDNEAIFPDAHPMSIVVYRTEANGSTFYRLHSLDNSFQSTWSIENTPRNDPQDWFIEVFDALPDAALIAADNQLPWQILVESEFPRPLEPNRIPPGAAMALYQERLCFAPLDDPDSIRFSLPLRNPDRFQIAPEFNDTNVVSRDNLGPVVAMTSAHERLILFTPSRIYTVEGRMPDATGSDGDLQIYMRSDGVGCMSSRSIAVSAGAGVFFQARQGIYRMDPGGNVEYIGADVEDYVQDAGMVLSAVAMEDRHQVRFVLTASDGTAFVLIYDWLMQLWSRALPPSFADDEAQPSRSEGAHGLAWRGLEGQVSHVMLQHGLPGFERAADDVPFSDQDISTNDIAIPLDVQTSWIHIGGVGGLHRIRKILLTLDRPNSSELEVVLEYDFGGYGTADFTQTVTFAAGTEIPLRIRPSVQKCTALRIRIRETEDAELSENLAITSITLVAAVKKGVSLVPPANMG